jgi:hypothetical protein
MRAIGFLAKAQLAVVALLTLIFAGLGTISAPPVSAEPFARGNKVCLECHKAEHEVWAATKHFASYRKVHKNKKAKKIVKSIGGKSMKKTAACKLCHYTQIQKAAGKKASVKSGPSCESCHGASSDWLNLHNDYGGPSVKMVDEDAAHKASRIKNAAAAGMIWASDRYGVAENCMSCHGLNNAKLDGKTLSAMLNADHPLNPDFELVRYSQGSVRHRYYAPKSTENAEMSAAELSVLFVEGQAAKLVSAVDALSKSDDARYQAAQKKRLAGATAALAAVKSVPEAAALLSAPTADNARKLVAAITGKDLTGEVGALLPKKADYK